MKKYKQTTELTKKIFFDAFWKLYNNTDNKITISNICKTANYNRTTFYRYFTDISDILSQFEDELINNLRNDISKRKDNFANIDIERFKLFTEKYGQYIIVFYEKGNKNFYEKLKELVINEVYDLLNFNIQGEVNKKFIYEFLFSSLIVSYSYWYKHSEIMSFEKYVKLLNNMLLNDSKTIISYLNK